MTTANEAAEAIVAKFVAAWAGATPIELDNEELEPAPGSPWVRLFIRESTRRQETMGEVGNRRFIVFAAVFVQVYTPLNTGVQQGDTLAQAAREALDSQTFSGLDFIPAVSRRNGPRGAWFLHTVQADFTYYEIK